MEAQRSEMSFPRLQSHWGMTWGSPPGVCDSKARVIFPLPQAQVLIHPILFSFTWCPSSLLSSLTWLIYRFCTAAAWVVWVEAKTGSWKKVKGLWETVGWDGRENFFLLWGICNTGTAISWMKFPRMHLCNLYDIPVKCKWSRLFFFFVSLHLSVLFIYLFFNIFIGV